jgi:hypothetical protein
METSSRADCVYASAVNEWKRLAATRKTIALRPKPRNSVIVGINIPSITRNQKPRKARTHSEEMSANAPNPRRTRAKAPAATAVTLDKMGYFSVYGFIWVDASYSRRGRKFHVPWKEASTTMQLMLKG